ncbi:WD40-repeat-containing domain protein [Mycena sp. CBHHK59/15]|nr:WD40-repeat-containing domain protein [Mycena sp. CBHHK59/15]
MNPHGVNHFSSRRRPILVPDLRNHAPALTRPKYRRNQAVQVLLETGFPFSRKLSAHTSCVNALAFSSVDGRFLASGGDDLNIHMWDLHEEAVSTPSSSFHGPRGNIFVLSFSAHNRYLFSGGTDDVVLKFDATQLERRLTPETRRSPEHMFHEHDDSIRAIAPHAAQDEIFLSGSEDGRILLHDGRSAVRAQDTIQLAGEVTGVQFHPVMEHIFATSDSKRVCYRTQDGVVQIYNTKLSRRALPHISSPEASSIVFNKDGRCVPVHYFPTIYALMDPHPVAVCSAPNLPDGTPVPPGERTYANSCTMKHGSFGGPGLDADVLYAAGSDDFRAYVWALPSPAELTAQRTVISSAEWSAGEHAGVVAPHGLAVCPRATGHAACAPGGHQSIVNTVLVHPRMLLAVTAGVEAGVVLHGATDGLLDGMRRTGGATRAVGGPWVPDAEDGEVEGGEEMWVEVQRDTIRLFDHILQHEGDADVFAVRLWAAGSEGSESGESGESSESSESESEDADMGSSDEDDLGD